MACASDVVLQDISVCSAADSPTLHYTVDCRSLASKPRMNSLLIEVEGKLGEADREEGQLENV